MLPELLRQLERDENFSSKMYKDTSNKWTIGFGWNIEDDGITEDMARQVLNAQALAAYRSASVLCPWLWNAPEPIRGVVVNLCFNMGAAKLATFKQFLAFIQEGDYERAATDLEGTEYATQVPRRAARLAAQLRTGIWQ